jgi:putative CocE/NonD family hydrolase
VSGDVESRPLPGFPGVVVERNVPCTMRDGVVLMADVYRPAEGGPYPVILIRIPYDKTQAENVAYTHPAWYAGKGYIVVSQDTRGRYASEGQWYPFKYETEDGYDSIEWAARLPNSTGKVGMYGFSYGGVTQLLPARLQPPSLAAICPAMTAAQYYEGWTFNQGAFALAFAASWALSLGINNARRKHDAAMMATYTTAFTDSLKWDWYTPLNEHSPLKSGETDYFFDWLAHPTYDDYWRQWSIDESYDQIDVPALHIAGWYDVFLSGTIKNFVELRRRARSDQERETQRLVVGPWFHIPWKPLIREAGDRASPLMVDDWQLAWFDQHLKSGAAALDAPVTVYILGDNEWRTFDTWPPAASTPTPWYLQSGGRANSKFGDGVLTAHLPEAAAADIFTYDPNIPNLSAGGHSCCFDFVAPMGPADQHISEESNGVLIYTSAPLERDLLLVGEVTLTLFAATSAVDTDWAARFCQVDPSGLSTNIQEGIVRARFRDSLSNPTLLVPDNIYQYEITLGPVGIRIPAGNRLRLHVSSSDFPQWDRNMNTGGVLGAEEMVEANVATQVVLHDAEYPSCLILPVVEE